MKRKMVVIGIAYILGLFIASFLSLRILVAVTLVGAVIICSVVLLRKVKASVAVTVTAAFLIGASLYSYKTVTSYNPIISLANTPTSFMGKVTEINLYSGDLGIYTLKGSFRSGEKGKIICLTDNKNCEYGDVMTVSGELIPIEGSYIYDSVRYNKGRSIFLQTDYGCTITLHKTNGHALIRSLHSYSERIKTRLYSLSGTVGGSLSCAMLFGDTSGLDRELEDSFYHSGLGPMLSVSGFHLIIFNMMFDLIGRKTRFQRILRFAVTCVFTILFSLMVMWPVSIMRAGLMLIISRSSSLFFRESDSLNSLSIAIILMTIAEPYIIHDAGFLLSVAGTFGVSTLAPWICGKLPIHGFFGALCETSIASALTTLCTIPICIVFFEETSLLSPISNVLFAPMCVIIMLCGVLIFFLGGRTPLSDIIGTLNEMVSELLAGCLRFTKEKIPVSFPCGWEELKIIVGICTVTVCVIFFITRSRRSVCLAAAAGMTVLFMSRYVLSSRFDDSLRVYVLGQDDELSAVVVYHGRTDVFDLSCDRKNARYIKSFLTRYGIDKAESLYINDKISSAVSSYNSAFYDIEVEYVMVGSEIEALSYDKVCGCIPVGEGQCELKLPDYTLTVDGAKLTVEAFGRTAVIYHSSDESNEYRGNCILRNDSKLHTKTVTYQGGTVNVKDNIVMEFIPGTGILVEAIE